MEDFTKTLRVQVNNSTDLSTSESNHEDLSTHQELEVLLQEGYSIIHFEIEQNRDCRIATVVLELEPHILNW